MSTNTIDESDTAVARLIDRIESALTEYMTVVPEGGDVYSVTSSSGKEYLVDAQMGRCVCPDVQYNLDEGEMCKHALRVEFALGRRSIPAVIDEDDVDPQLGMHVDAE